MYLLPGKTKVLAVTVVKNRINPQIVHADEMIRKVPAGSQLLNGKSAFPLSGKALCALLFWTNRAKSQGVKALRSDLVQMNYVASTLNVQKR